MSVFSPRRMQARVVGDDMGFWRTGCIAMHANECLTCLIKLLPQHFVVICKRCLVVFELGVFFRLQIVV